ncbi:MAG: alpha/beta hydrolase [Gemmatales bacterium]
MKLGCYFCLIALALPGCAGMGSYSPLLPVERAMLYQPERDEGGGEHVTDAWFTTDDGKRLHGRFFDHPQRRAVILYCHGNAGSVETWSMAALELQQQHQCAVFVFDYRGYGKSEGTPSEEGLYQDARAARRWLAQKTGVSEKEIVVLGRSLGGGVAVDLASKDGAKGLILQSTFSSLPDVAAYHVPWLLPHLNMTQRFDSVAKIKNYAGPLLQCHGDVDRLIPISLAQTLYVAAPGQKRFITIPGGGHNDPPNGAFHEALDDFLKKLPDVKR